MSELKFALGQAPSRALPQQEAINLPHLPYVVAAGFFHSQRKYNPGSKIVKAAIDCLDSTHKQSINERKPANYAYNKML